MLQPIHHSKRRYWEIGLSAPSLEFKANDGPSKEGRDEECDMCLFFASSTFSICRPRRSVLFIDYCVDNCGSVFAKNLLRQYDDNWLSPIIYLIKIGPARRQSAVAVIANRREKLTKGQQVSSPRSLLSKLVDVEAEYDLVRPIDGQRRFTSSTRVVNEVFLITELNSAEI
ncbi:Protein of unknown function [Cotesia congregata]|uniref:Uncharacterized protein n=1 Tax=Cotesia congregata TaxID=51543 RepID=A0A8J2HCG0_COTCN|nr:Protein of unknown function [Cotesia congregata]